MSGVLNVSNCMDLGITYIMALVHVKMSTVGSILNKFMSYLRDLGAIKSKRSQIIFFIANKNLDYM